MYKEIGQIGLSPIEHHATINALLSSGKSSMIFHKNYQITDVSIVSIEGNILEIIICMVTTSVSDGDMSYSLAFVSHHSPLSVLKYQ